ncbi:MAG: PhzF family phenazine biosynthesis protein [Streptomycetales bacterium]
MPELHVLSVFLGPNGRGGNPLGVFLEGAAVPAPLRQQVAADLGFSETVFVDDAASGGLRIFTPATELPLAGHPLVGTSWLLARLGRPVDVLRPPAGEVPTWQAGEMTWIRGRPEWAPDFALQQLASPADVDAHPGAGPDELLEIWSWDDESRGQVRARVFPTVVGVAEDEATGSAALRLAAALGRSLRIRQGVGSVIEARPYDDGTVAVGGETALVETRDHPLPS